jgi:hypothetical protein
MSNSPDPRTLKICEKELAKLEKGKKKNGGKAPADIEQQMGRYRELIRRLS